jgi:SAM-dependent methyltransferase
VDRWIGEPRGDARLLDFASGSGRHARLALARGFRVLAVDRDRALLDMGEVKDLELRVEDLESGRWSFSAERFQVVVVTNFLHRPRLDLLPELLEPGGRLVYETFALGNATYGKPSNPSFLLQPDELFLLARRANLQVRAFEQGYVATPKPALLQRMVAVRLPAHAESLPLALPRSGAGVALS